MDFVDWCGILLGKLVELGRTSAPVRTSGTTDIHLASALFGEQLVTGLTYHGSSQRMAVFTALLALEATGLVARRGSGMMWQATALGRSCAADASSLWESICLMPVEQDAQSLLSVVNRLSSRASDDHAWLETVSAEIIREDPDWSGDEALLRAQIQELSAVGLVKSHGLLAFQATYPGLVRETRYALTTESRFIDELVASWETANVDFKSELHTDTKDQKAELIKDVIGLANTQVTGRRWLIIGFEPKTHAYSGPPSDPRITSDHLEQLMAEYTRPHLDLRYAIVDYRAGKVGKLEVLREPLKLPYRVAKAITGASKKITDGQIFVRHSSQTVEAPDYEVVLIQEEGDRSRSPLHP